MKTCFTILILIFSISTGIGQVITEVPEPPYIKTIQFSQGSEQSQLPLIKLGETLNLSFDDIIGDEADYYYTIGHYNYDWAPSALSKTEYMEGFDDSRIYNYTNSLGTLQLYTHYTLSIPNKYTKGLTKSGNYLLSVYNSADEIIFTRKFMIYEPQVTVGVEILRTRDLSVINEKQTVNFRVDSGDNLLINTDHAVKTVIIKNNNLHDAIFGLKPQYTLGSVLEYRYDSEASFYAGNEFLYFDNSDLRGANTGVQTVELKKLYHTYLYTTITRKDRPYTYNPDINGNFVIRTLQGTNANSEAEYCWIHFSVKHPQRPVGQEVYLNGSFNNYTLSKAYKLNYNEEFGVYEKPVLLKQGFYNYNYVVVDAEGKIMQSNPISGDFWQTENEYDVLIYYRSPGSRYDKLIGAGTALSTNISNVRQN